MSRKRFRFCSAALLAAALTAGAITPAFALSSDKAQPIELEADAAELDDARQRSVYTGNVVLVQGSMRLTADRLTVKHRERRPDFIVAEGKVVTFRQLPDGEKTYHKARARRAEYSVDSDVIVLIKDAVLVQGPNEFRSDRIVYDRVKAVVRAGARVQGKERVRIVIQPEGEAATR